jgi:hypothetical protein
MKKFLLFISVLVTAFACNNASKNETNATDSSVVAMNTEPTDSAQAHKDLGILLDSLDNAFKRKDISFVEKYMSKDGIYLGTDPEEILTYDQYHDYMVNALKDTTMKSWDFTVARRLINAKGSSAILVEQFMFPSISKKVMLRTISHARYENNRWVIDMHSYNMIPKNAEIPKIDKAL